jgi:hypothetical protein
MGLLGGGKVSIVASNGVHNSFSGFIVLCLSGKDQVCCSFTCLPRAAQSLTVVLGESVSLEIFVTSDVPKSATD